MFRKEDRDVLVNHEVLPEMDETDSPPCPVYTIAMEEQARPHQRGPPPPYGIGGHRRTYPEWIMDQSRTLPSYPVIHQPALGEARPTQLAETPPDYACKSCLACLFCCPCALYYSDQVRQSQDRDFFQHRHITLTDLLYYYL